jgi:hypothetical protein
MKRWRLLAAGLVFLAVVVLTAPLWSGYLGPEAAAYTTAWRPWRSDLSVELTATKTHTDTDVMVAAHYDDPWPGAGRAPGEQHDFMTVERSNSLLPWRVTAHGTGP